MSNPDLPAPFQEMLKGGPIPPVDPEDLKRMWQFLQDVGKQDRTIATGFDILKTACSPDADVLAVWGRYGMLSMVLKTSRVLAPWQRGNKLDDVVFHVAATFPMNGMKAGQVNSEWPFDVDGFLRKLREEE